MGMDSIKSAEAPRASLPIVLAVLLAISAVMVVPATIPAQTSGGVPEPDSSARYVEVEVTDETFVRDVAEVTFFYDLPKGTEVTFNWEFGGQETVVADGTPSQVSLRVPEDAPLDGGGYPVTVQTTIGGRTYTNHIYEGWGRVSVFHDGPISLLSYAWTDAQQNRVTRGQEATVQAGVQNWGDAGHTKYVMTVEDSESNVGPEVVKTKRVYTDAGESDNFRISWDTNEVRPGTYEVTITGPENEVTTPIIVEERADFYPIDVEAPRAVSPGDQYTLEVTIRNRGTGPGTERVELWLGGESGDHQTLSLDAGESERIELGFRIPESIEPGVYYVSIHDQDGWLTSLPVEIVE